MTSSCCWAMREGCNWCRGTTTTYPTHQTHAAESGAVTTPVNYTDTCPTAMGTCVHQRRYLLGSDGVACYRPVTAHLALASECSVALALLGSRCRAPAARLKCFASSADGGKLSACASVLPSLLRPAISCPF